MAAESNMTKLNTIIGIVIGILGLITWATGYSNAPEMFFGKDCKEKLPEQKLMVDTAAWKRSLVALEQRVEELRRDTGTDTVLLKVDSTKIDTTQTSLRKNESCNLDGKKYTGQESHWQYIEFVFFDNTSYLIDGELHTQKQGAMEIKGVVKQTSAGVYKIISGDNNLSGEMRLLDNCKTLKGTLETNDGKRIFTYYNISN